MPFTGTADVIRFKGLLNEVLIQSELGGASPYTLSSAKAGRSGYSFGVPQYDLSVVGSMAGDQTARDLFKGILRNATDSNGNYLIDDGNPATSRENDSLVDTLYNKAISVGGSSLLPSEKKMVNDALNSTYGRQNIDGALDGTLQLRINKADGVIALTAGSDRAFLESDLGKLFLCDYENQYTITPGGALEKFVQGLPAFGITKQGVLGVDDLLNFYFRTQQSQATPYDPVRRFANVVEVAGGYTPTDVDEAKGVLQAYTFFVFPQKTQIILANASALTEFMTRVINPAKAPVIQTYASGTVPFGAGSVAMPTIDGEVLVGRDTGPALVLFETLKGTSQGDLLMGEGGMDRLEGGSGTDVLYGGEGSDTLLGGTEADVLFGEDGFDTLEGGAGEDALFGGDNADTLIGGEGNDKLAGGAGNDTYYYNNGDGNDTILDSDGLGAVTFNAMLLTGGLRLATDPQNTWHSADGAITYVKQGADLLVNNTVTIEAFDFAAGELGITLTTRPDSTRPSLPMIDFNNGQPAIVWEGDDSNNTPLFDAGANHIAYGRGGFDVISFIAYSEFYNHQVYGGLGNDTVDGGGGGDVLLGYGHDDVLVGGTDQMRRTGAVKLALT